MSERLTDKDLEMLRMIAETHHRVDFASWKVLAMVAELRERRAADLSADDVEALRTIVNSVNEWGSVCVSEVALSVVRRIIAGGGK